MRKLLLSLMLCGVFIMTGCGTTQEADVPDETVEDAEDVAPETVERMGSYELEECRNPGIYVLMPDGSFERYRTGYVLYWRNELMTYGTESYPSSLIMYEHRYKSNSENLKKGELVLFCSEDYIVMNGMFPVTESGRALSYYDKETDKTTVLLMENSIDYNDHVVFDSWEIVYGNGECKRSEVQIETIDGIPSEDCKDTYSIEGRHHVDVPEDTVFKMGVSEGTTLFEKEFEADYMYFLQEVDLGYWGSEDKYEFKLHPTTDGYAVFDFSEIPPGDYILNVSWWSKEDRGRVVLPTFITIE